MNTLDMHDSLREVLSGTDDMIPAAFSADWEAMECLGHSDHCETLLLRHRKTGSKAVLKLVKQWNHETDLADKLQALAHKSLPRMLKVCVQDDRLCILREYIDGETLADVNRRFSIEETIRIALQLCDALEYLHRLTPPLIHRDVKPENILLQPDGTVALIDFGIARLFSEKGEKDTRVMGTESFAPPEQYGFQQTDCRSDLFALGKVMGWMLTGSYRSEDYAVIPDKRLVKIINKCGAFSPDDRFASAAEVRKSLERLRKPKRTLLSVAAVLCVLVLASVGLFLLKGQSGSVLFSEPLIEQAVRQTLGLSAEAPLSAEQLSTVEGLYLFGNVIVLSQDDFYAAAGSWYASDTKAHGPVTQLTDVQYLPNLRSIMIAANHITDLSPLSAMTGLEIVEFKHNSIRDISPLRGLAQLRSVGLNDNPMTDVSTLLSLPSLRFLDLCDASSYDPSVIHDLGDLQYLDISNRTDSWRSLGARYLRELKLGWTRIDSLEPLAALTGLERLGIEHTLITSLDGIEQHTQLSYLRMSGCEVADLSPLLLLPNLETLILSQEQRAAAEALGAVPFTISYE